MVVMGKIEVTDGRTVLVRGASAGYIPDIARLLGELSPESLRPRFQGGPPTPRLAREAPLISRPRTWSRRSAS
jgi:hypothetical protein